MAYQSASHIICLGDVKQAALYFDTVIPVNINQLQEHSNPAQLTRDLIDGFGSSNSLINENFLGKLKEIKSSLDEMHEIIKSLLRLKRNSNDAYNKKLCELPFDKRKAAIKFVNYFLSTIDSESKESIKKELFNILLGFSYMEGVEINNGVTVSVLVNELSSLTKSTSLSVLLPEQCLLSEDENNCDISLILPNMSLIDTSDTSWRQILEFRKDKNALKKLRNLRLFFEDNYNGKDRQYIEDDLMKRLDDYEQIRKEWGFETITSTIGVVLDSKNIQASFFAALAGLYLGDLSGAVIAGTCIEIFKGCLHVINCRHAFKTRIMRDDLAYIIQAKETLE